MTPTWKATTLGTICKFQAGNGFPKDLQGDIDGEYPVAKVSDMNLAGNELFIINANNWLSKKAVDQAFKLHQPGAVVFAKIGIALTTNRRRILVRPTVIDNNMMSATCTKDIDPRWFYSLLTTLDFNEISSGSALPFLTVRDLSKIPICLPPLPEQRAIAATLGALDDKIELNRKMNATLEAMARALFRDWFVDFGPTRAKMEGRAPYLSPDLWSLFPDRLDDEGKPEGWEVVSFGSLLDSTIGGDWGKGEADAKHTVAVAIVRGTDIPDLLIGGSNRVPRRFVEAKKLEKRKLEPGDIVIEVSGGSPTQPTGRSLYFTQAMLDRFSVPLLPTSFCKRFRPKSIDLGLILTQHLQNLYAEGGTWEYQNQSTGIANFQTSHFLEAERVVVPSMAVLKAFSDFCMPIMEKMQSKESQFLSQTRDLLLPRLMSGELRVAEAERLASEVA
ncbi:type I restriction enzyme S subunit [Rhodobacteraceae bacterium MBR-64]|jgi:type I restriction enzyme S subunit